MKTGKDVIGLTSLKLSKDNGMNNYFDVSFTD